MRNRKPTGTLRLRGTVYWAQWKHGGVPYAVSLGTKDPDEANVRFDEQMKVVVASIAEGTHQERFGRKDAPPVVSGNDVRLSDAWAIFLHSGRREDASPQTTRQYGIQFDRFLDWLRKDRREVTLLSQVTEDVAEQFAAHLEATVSPSTFNRYRDLLARVFDILLAKAGAGAANPWQPVRRKKVTNGRKNRRRVLTADEVQRVFRTIRRRMEGFEPVPTRHGRVYEREIPQKERDAAAETFTLCLIGYHTGLRLIDACLLEWDGVDLGQREIRVVPRKTERASGETLVIPIHPELLAHLASIRPPAPDKHVMPGKAKQYATNRSDIVKRLSTVFRHAGLALHKEGTGAGTGRRAVADVGFHSFRHGWVSAAQRNGFDQASVQAIAGWSSPAMIRNYTHVTKEHLARQMDAMPSILDGGCKTQDAKPNGVAGMGDDDLRILAEKVAVEIARRKG